MSDFKDKMQQIRFPHGLTPPKDHDRGANSIPSDP